MDFLSKTFDELTTTELYEILKSRTEVFMLEQGIICQDMDDVDYRSLHCFMTDGKRVTAYLRAFRKDCDTVVLGRILTLVHRNGTGTELMKRSLPEIQKVFGCKRFELHAQKQAVGFYQKLGFEIISDEFLEEGVLHVTMELKI